VASLCEPGVWWGSLTVPLEPKTEWKIAERLGWMKWFVERVFVQKDNDVIFSLLWRKSAWRKFLVKA
jgi:hypothetical protein